MEGCSPGPVTPKAPQIRMVLAQIGVMREGLHLCVSRQLYCHVLVGCKARGAPGKAAMLHQLLAQGSQRACLGCGLTLLPQTHSPSPGGWLEMGSTRLGWILPLPSCCKPPTAPAEPSALFGV